MSKPYIGGQAVLEGVMMRSPKSFVVAVRRPDGTIAVREQKWETLFPRLPFLRWPFFRGAIVLLESIHNGFSALKFSADQALSEQTEKADEPKTDVGTTLVLVLATLMMVALFIATPHLLTFGLSVLLGGRLPSDGFAFHFVDGFFRLAILIGYIGLLSRTQDAKRLFEYHGAEHKAIWVYESQLPLTVENTKKFSTLHPRCGTSFLFVVVAVAVLVHAALVPWVPRMHASEWINQLLLVLVKIPMAFPIAGAAYEFQRLSARDSCPAWIRWLTLPGMWMQNITTREPSDAQLEIALLALQRALAREEGRAQVPDGILEYPDFIAATQAA